MKDSFECHDLSARSLAIRLYHRNLAITMPVHEVDGVCKWLVQLHGVQLLVIRQKFFESKWHKILRIVLR